LTHFGQIKHYHSGFLGGNELLFLSIRCTYTENMSCFCFPLLLCTLNNLRAILFYGYTFKDFNYGRLNRQGRKPAKLYWNKAIYFLVWEWTFVFCSQPSQRNWYLWVFLFRPNQAYFLPWLFFNIFRNKLPSKNHYVELIFRVTRLTSNEVYLKKF